MRRTLVIVAFVVAVVGALALRVVIEGRRALAAGDDWMLRGKPGEAIRTYETAARWYLPLAPHVDDAYGQLLALAHGADPAVSLQAWRAIRSAARATRSLWTPHAADLALADAAIANISAGIPQAASGDPAWHRARLAEDARPGIGAAALAGFGILLWLGGAIGLARSGIGSQGPRRGAQIAGVLVVVGLACWAVGLYNA